MKLRRVLFDIHSWLGLKLSILMTFILVTGTIAVFSYEVDWLLNPEMRALPPANPEPITWGEAYDAAIAAYPDGKLFYLKHLALDPWWASEADFETPSGNLVRVWINPYTGEYQGATGWFNVQRFFRQAHRHLMLPNDIGIPIVTLLAFPMLFALATGLVIYKKFWQGFFKWPRFDRSPRIWLGDLHRLGALWSLWFLPLIALTSVWYLVEELGGRAPPFPRADPVIERTGPLPAGFSGADLDALIARARAHRPALDVRSIRLPRRADAGIKIEGQTDAMLVRNRANTVTLDPQSLEIIGSYTAHNLGIHHRISEMADPLHFGTFGGMLTKIIWFVFGAVLSGLAISGVYIYGLRVVTPIWKSA